MKIIPKDAYKRSTWKNGLGHTDEIAIHPEGSSLVKGDFLWRLSSARIEKSSPFSVFPSHDRVLVILKGPGVRLTHTFEEGGDEETVDLPALEPYDFPGDIGSRCELKSGAVTDFSVFVRKGEIEPMVELTTVQEGETHSWSPQGRWNFVFSVTGNFHVSAPFFEGILSEGDTAEISTPEGEVTFQADGEGMLLTVSLA